MDLAELLRRRPEWALSPCLYVITQDQNFNPKISRCGASGTRLFQGSDVPFRSDENQSVGLIGRVQTYYGYHLPNSSKIHAALRVRQRLVARVGDRVEGDSAGNSYAVNRNNFTEVLFKEAIFHQRLDAKGYRWMKDRRNELFQPQSSTNQLVDVLRTVEGIEMYLLEPQKEPYLDPRYDGGTAVTAQESQQIQMRITEPRQTPMRTASSTARAPQISIRLSKEAIAELQKNNPTKYALLVQIVRAAIGTPPVPERPKVVTTPPTQRPNPNPNPERTVALTRSQRATLLQGRVTRSMGNALFGGL
jgi:hypothetical protein